MNTKQIARRNLKLVMLESALTAGLISMSIMTPFFYSIGLSQLQISGTQIIFTIIAMFLNIPTGWLADRFSRKWANVIGDFGCAATFLCYSMVNSFAGAVACECMLGFFISLSQGVDSGLIHHFCHQIDTGEDFFRRQNAKLHCWRYVATIILVWLGGPLGAINFRLAIALSGVPELLAGITGFFVADDSKKLIAQRDPLADMWRIAQQSFRQPQLRLRIIAYAVGRELTHAIIWVFTPLLIMAGVPLAVVSVAWAINAIMCLLGAKLAALFSIRMKDWQLFALPLALMCISLGVISYHLNIISIWFYLIMGIIQGWTGATLLPLLQRYVSPTEQTTVVSLAHVISRLVYIPASFIVGYVADIQLSRAPLASLLFFLPLGLFVLRGFLRE